MYYIIMCVLLNMYGNTQEVDNVVNDFRAKSSLKKQGNSPAEETIHMIYSQCITM